MTIFEEIAETLENYRMYRNIETLAQDIIRLAKKEPELYPILIDIHTFIDELLDKQTYMSDQLRMIDFSVRKAISIEEKRKECK